MVQTQSMEKLIKQQFSRRLSEVALGHCFTVDKICRNATKPPHLILTQFIKRITYRRHGRLFFFLFSLEVMNLQLNTVSMTLGKSTELNENEESEKCTFFRKACLF